MKEERKMKISAKKKGYKRRKKKKKIKDSRNLEKD